MVAFTDVRVRAQDNDTNVTFLQVERITQYAVGELYELARHYVLEAMCTGDTVTDLNDRTNVNDLNVRLIFFNLLSNQRADFFRFDTQLAHPYLQCLRLIQRFFQALKFAGQASVIQTIADPNLNAAQQAFIENRFHTDLFARNLAEGCRNAGELRFRQSYRRVNRCIRLT
ncbi:hypothetical protein D3C73_1090780 [compost metagenome]